MDAEGVEPPAFTVSRCCATRLRHASKTSACLRGRREFRDPGLRGFNPALFQAELSDHDGAGHGDRTRRFPLTKRAHSPSVLHRHENSQAVAPVAIRVRRATTATAPGRLHARSLLAGSRYSGAHAGLAAGADNGPRTRCHRLGKAVLVHMSFIRMIGGPGSSSRSPPGKPTRLAQALAAVCASAIVWRDPIVWSAGLEPASPAWHAGILPLNYGHENMEARPGIEPG